MHPFGRIFAGIDATNTKIEHSHLEIADEAKSAVKGGFHYGVCRRPGVYLPPRPLMNHGPHRCKSGTNVAPILLDENLTSKIIDFFEVVALSEALPKELLQSRPTREKIAEAVQGKVLAWGLWVGAYERKWQ